MKSLALGDIANPLDIGTRGLEKHSLALMGGQWPPRV